MKQVQLETTELIQATDVAASVIKVGLDEHMKDMLSYIDTLVRPVKYHTDFIEKELAVSIELGNNIEVAKNESLYLSQSRQRLMIIRLEAMLFFKAAKEAESSNDPAKLDIAKSHYDKAVSNFAELIDLHQKAIKDTKRDAFKDRLESVAIHLKSIGEILMKMCSNIKRLSDKILEKISRKSDATAAEGGDSHACIARQKPRN